MLTMKTNFYQSLFAIAFLAGFVSLRAARAQEAQVGKLTGHPDQGKQLYRRYCIGCHGPRGDGAGENAPYIDPKPRNFTQATFKCRSTPTGTLPLDSDLYNSIGLGFDNSNMPSCAPWTDQERINLVAFIKTFSPRGKNDKAGSRFKCGATNQDIYRIFMTGVDGTPMPSLADVIQPNDAWDLVHFLRTLQVNREGPERALLKSSGTKLQPIQASSGGGR